MGPMRLRALLLPLVLLALGAGAAAAWPSAGALEPATEAPATPDAPTEAEESAEEDGVDPWMEAPSRAETGPVVGGDASAPSPALAVQTPPPKR